MSLRPVAIAVFLYSLALILFELLLTRIFAVTLFASFAHLALALALLGIGVGATLQHLWPSLVPKENVQTRLGTIGILLGVSVILATLAALYFPVLQLPDKVPDTYQDTSSLKDQLLRHGWFAALLPVLALPFTWAGLAFAGAFQRLKEHIGLIYAADLVGGAVGAVLFIPLLENLAGPDVVFIVAMLAFLGAGLAYPGGAGRTIAWGLAFSSFCIGLAGLKGEILSITNTAGFSESLVTETRWTALTRLAVFEDPYDPHIKGPKVLVLLDNASASEVPMDAEDRLRMAAQETRSIVYRLHSPTSRVAILAASAGPEVACAQALGFSDIDAIDIASEIFDIVATRFASSPVNPYTQAGVKRVHMDGRAAILQASAPYDIIHMVHANLWSAAGILANTWSPALLETKDAFHTYLNQLAEDGTISFGRGADTALLARAAGAALKERGMEKPWQSIAYLQGNSQLVLIKKHPWTAEEQNTLDQAMRHYPALKLSWALDSEEKPEAWAKLARGPVMTDERPYVDSFSSVQGALNDVAAGKADTPLAALYRSVLVQLLFALVAGVLFVGVPFASKGRSELKYVKGSGWMLAFVATLGYGYLAIETTLVHQLVLFVGHPTYAITVVVLAMLLSSGLGSFYAGKLENPLSKLPLVMGVVVVAGAIVAWGVPPLLYASLLGIPLIFRILVTFLVLLPVGFFMGMPFTLSVRSIPDSASGVVPWAWAINGWMSVVASLATVLVARLWGYTDAYGVALFAYILGLVLATQLKKVA